jgi:hypothetical protein
VGARRQEFNSTNQISGFQGDAPSKISRFLRIMEINISLPENLFDAHQESFLKQKRVVNKFILMLRNEQERLKKLGLFRDSDATRSLKQRIAIENSKLKSIKNEMEAYWDYTILRAINPEKYKFNHKEFLDQVSEFLSIGRKEVMRKKRRIVNLGFASIVNKEIIFISKDRVWEHYGVLINKHKKDSEGNRIAHQKLGVYKEAGIKSVSVQKGEINSKTGETYTKDKKFEFRKKLNVKVLKFKITKEQLNKTDLRRQAMLAFCKLNVDRAFTQLMSENLREIEQEDLAVDLTCDYLARKVGYVSAVSGWSGRLELEDTGFIDIEKHKVEFDSNINYQDAKEKYSLHSGIDENTGYAYYYCKREQKVWGVKCYSLAVNAYQPICYRKVKEKSKTVKEPKRWEKWWERSLRACDGCSIQKMFGSEHYLFEIDSISDYLYYLLDRNSKFVYSQYEEWNSKRVESFTKNTYGHS